MLPKKNFGFVPFFKKKKKEKAFMKKILEKAILKKK
jgi:uncharacterized protein YqgQ